MSGPMAEGGPLPEPDRELLAQHERRLADWRRERDEARNEARDDPGEDEVLHRIRDGIEEL